MQFYDVSQTSLAHSGSSVAEEYIPLWMADGTNTNVITASSGTFFFSDGGGFSNSSGSSSIRLHTLNSNWSPTQKFALEVVMWMGSSSYTVSCALWDFTSGTILSTSQISTSSSTAIVVRSSQFTLTPGHTYGVTIWSNTTGTSLQATDASLVVFGQ